MFMVSRLVEFLVNLRNMIRCHIEQAKSAKGDANCS